jgi:signal peptidase II
VFFKGIYTSILILAADQLHKWYMLEIVNIANIGNIEVTPFFNLVMVWNPGVSFGMGQGAENAPLIFSAISLIIVIGLLFWLKNSTSNILTYALGFIIGGAIGNVIDRLRFNAVADFFDFYIMGYHWPSFNIADSAVFIGAAMLFVDSIISEKSKDND